MLFVDLVGDDCVWSGVYIDKLVYVCCIVYVVLI